MQGRVRNDALVVLWSLPGEHLLPDDFRELPTGMAPLTAYVYAADDVLLRFRQ